MSLPTGAAVAALTGAVTPEQAGPLGPVVAALPVFDDGGRDAGAAALGDVAGPVVEPDAQDPARADDGTAGDTVVSPTTSGDGTEAMLGDLGAPVIVVPAEPSASPEPSASASAAAAEGGPEVLTPEAAAVVELTNAERAAAGCPALTVDERLTAAARLHSEDMVAQGYFDHTSLDGRTPWDRAKAQGYTNPSGENIAAGQPDAEAVVRAWMDSPGHRENILNCDFREIGVGEVDQVWTQLFGWG
ncbi:CAP domain-containing protein [Antribacter sp. KLBMP9083]|uniref:CAP domain-containing protein n=1 Tax=Antribacter soli TaxID=2910976 RepID=A0AA41U5U6_9MICO|nr:CAP domain-containing protein [Antribacter soli]MCF4120388.1 CAP domain-containing protein [Antribacter soli]